MCAWFWRSRAEREGRGNSPQPRTDVGAEAQVTTVDCRVNTDSLDKALADREALIELCLYAMDRAHSAGVVQRLSEGLDGVGVSRLRPDGERFDPACHEANGTVETDDPELDGRIAETEAVGFTERDRVLRAPIVTVYQLPSDRQDPIDPPECEDSGRNRHDPGDDPTSSGS
jgi:molecular chaperone GrpE